MVDDTQVTDPAADAQPDATTPEAVEPSTPTGEREPAPDATRVPEAEGRDTDDRADDALGAAGQRALEREREARREAERELREHRERVRELELESARREVAALLRLSDEQAALLRGESAEAMREHGEQIIAAFAPRRWGRPLAALHTGAVGRVEPADTPADIARDVLTG